MTTSTKSRKAQQTIIVLATYIFTHLSRICFTVRSSDGSATYNTDGHGSCTCDGNAVWHRECKHIKHLAPIAAEKLAERTQKEDFPFENPPSSHVCATCNGAHNTYDHEWAIMSLDERQAAIDRLNDVTPVEHTGNNGYVDAEYEQWKRDNGLDGKLSREAYTQEFSIY